MDGVGTPIIERPRPLSGHDTPNPANNTYTLNYEEPTTPAPPMALPKRSTVASNTYTAPPSGYETSPTTPPEHSTKMTDSSHNSPNYEEPRMRLRIYKTTFETL